MANSKKGPEIGPNERVVLYFQYSHKEGGQGDYIDLPFRLLRDVTVLIEKKIGAFVPIVRYKKKDYYYGVLSGLRPL